jgi:hypothetical protein
MAWLAELFGGYAGARAGVGGRGLPATTAAERFGVSLSFIAGGRLLGG